MFTENEYALIVQTASLTAENAYRNATGTNDDELRKNFEAVARKYQRIADKAMAAQRVMENPALAAYATYSTE